MNNTLRILTWNCRRAKEYSAVWDYVLEVNPDIALLQEVSGIPKSILSSFACCQVRALGRTGLPQKFKTVILTKGQIGDNLFFAASEDWVVNEIAHFEGDLVAKQITLNDSLRLNVVSVYSPAWYLDPKRLENVDTSQVHLTLNNQVWVADLLRYSLSQMLIGSSELWMIGGDFNLSETFDQGRNGPRGNREYLDRMAALGLTEVLRHSQGKLTPTFRSPRGGSVRHQIDHLFVSQSLAQKLVVCATGPVERIFLDKGLSDHLPIIADFQL